MAKRKTKTRRERIVESIEAVAFDPEYGIADRLRALNILLGLEEDSRSEETNLKLDEILRRISEGNGEM